MKKCALFLVLWTGLYCLSAQEVIPVWFKSVPIDTEANLTVGYTGKFRDKNLARRVALNQARKNLAKQLKIRLIFEIQELSDGYYRLIQPTFEKIFCENINAYVDSNSVILDSAFIDDRYYILLASDANFSDFDSSQTTWGAKPPWIESLPKSNKYVYGLGMVANYSYWKNGWQDADGYARFDACKNLKINTSSIRTQNRMNRRVMNRKILRQSVDITAENSRIIKRWYDLQRDVFYSLCRIPVQNSK